MKKGKKKKADSGLPIDPRIQNAIGMAYNRELDLDEMDIMKYTKSQRINPNFSNAMLPNFTSDLPPSTEQNRRKSTVGRDLIASGFPIINAFVPGQSINRYPIVQPGRSYNPNPYGTGSQAIMKSGGPIPKAYNPNLASKDKDFQKWYTANTLEGQRGIPYSDKLDYDYFSFFKNQAKGSIQDHFPDTYKRPNHKTFSIESIYSTPENPGGRWEGENFIPSMNRGGPIVPVPRDVKYSSPNTANDDIELADLVGYSLGEGNVNPLSTEYGRILFTRLRGSYGDGNAQNFITDLSLFNQDTNNKNLSPQGRIKKFYSMGDRTGIKNRLNRFGYGPENVYENSPDVHIQKQRGVGLLAKMKSGGSIKNKSGNYFDGGTIEFNGPSHENGGIDISYGGKRVEVEGGETGVFSPDGTLNIMGNMTIPGTKTKFKSASKKIADKESTYNKILDKASSLLNQNDPTDGKYSRLKYNSGVVMEQGATAGLADLSVKKERLSNLQNEMLYEANRLGLDPISFSEGGSKKAKNGARIKAAPGTSVPPEKKKKDSVAVRHNNPGNIKFGKWAEKYGAVQGEPATDGGYFAKFPDTGKGLEALKGLLKSKNYKNLDVESAIKRWTNNSGYNIPLKDLAGKKISDLSASQFDNLVNTITFGEDGKYYNQESNEAVLAPEPINYNDVYLPNRNISSEISPNNPLVTRTPPNIGRVNIANRPEIPSNIQGLSAAQILPELLAFGTNRERPVNLQQYTPELLQDYEVSFQDRRNNNTSTFNALQRTLGDSPGALSILAAQKYEADNAVNAEEFRTNQAIQNQVTNANVQLLNEAERFNLGLADQQFVRQSTANSKTRAQNQLIANSLSSKYLQNRLENTRLSVYENLYDFRYDDRDGNGIIDQLNYYGPDAVFTNSTGTSSTNPYTQMMTEMDASGNIKRQRTRTPSLKQQEEQDLRIQERRNRMPLTRQFNLGF